MTTTLSGDRLREIIRRNGGIKENILGMLLDMQSASPNRCIDAEMAAFVSQELGLSETRVYEIASYYAMLKVKPHARYVLEVCNSSPCYFSKSDEIAGILCDALGVEMGQSTPDGMFALHYTPCVGACDIGPVIKIGNEVYGDLTDKKIRRLLMKLRRDAAREEVTL